MTIPKIELAEGAPERLTDEEAARLAALGGSGVDQLALASAVVAGTDAGTEEAAAAEQLMRSRAAELAENPTRRPEAKNTDTRKHVLEVVTESTLATLTTDADFFRANAEGSATHNQTIRHVGGGDEREKLEEILKRLEATQRVGLEQYTDKRGKEPPYFRMVGERYKADRDGIEDDLVWLKDDKRTLTPLNDTPYFRQRREVFDRYAQVLIRLRKVNAMDNPSDEQGFLARNNGSIVDAELVGNYSTDPENVKGAGKFLLMLAVGGLLALNGISDVMNKRFSFVTMVLLGGIIMLVGKSEKYGFLGGKGFDTMTRYNFNGEGIRSLMRLRGGQKNLLLSYFGDRELCGPTVTEESVKYLTNKKRHGVRAISIELANKFLGSSTAYAHNFVQNMYTIRTDDDRGVALEYADANHDSGKAGRDVRSVLGNAAASAAVTGAASGATPSNPTT